MGQFFVLDMIKAPANLPLFVDVFFCHMQSWQFSAACLACPQRAVSALFSLKAAVHTFTRHIYQHQYDFCPFSKCAVEISKSRMCLCLSEPSPGDGQLGGSASRLLCSAAVAHTVYKTWSKIPAITLAEQNSRSMNLLVSSDFMDFIVVVSVTFMEVCECSISLACQL